MILNKNSIFVRNPLYMNEVAPIYFNDFGMSFYWKRQTEINYEKVQLIFKETGFYLDFNQLKIFSTLIVDSQNKKCCNACKHASSCAKILLKTPLNQVDLAVSNKELENIKDLIEGTIFAIELDRYIFGVGKN